MSDLDSGHTRRYATLSQDMSKNQSLIAQSNSRAGNIAQVFAGALALLTVLTAVAKGDPSGLTYVLGVLTGLGLLGTLCGLAVHLWPRLVGLPKDTSEAAYQARLELEADTDDEVANLDYKQGYRLQRILFIKENSARFTLVSLLVMVTCMILAYLSL